MTFLKRAEGSIRRFANKATPAIKRFAQKAVSVAGKVAMDIGEKVLPAVEKIAGGVGKGLTVAEGVVGGFAPELVPIVDIARRGAGMIQRGAMEGGKAFATARNVVTAVNRGRNALQG
jgi:hypothetical protein